jgi:cytochrome P450
MVIRNTPPRPKSRFPMAYWLQFARSPLDFLSQCAQKYGDIVDLTLPTGRAYLISHPSYIEYMLITHKNDFKKGHFFDVLRPVMGNGLITSEREVWLRQRRIAQPAFHRSRFKSYAQVMVDHIEHTLLGWHDGDVRDVQWEMVRLTMSIITQLLFDTDVTDEAETGRVLEVCLEECAARLRNPVHVPERIPTPSNLRYRQALQKLDQVIQEIITRHRATNHDSGDLLSVLLQARDEDGSQMDDQQLRDELVTFFIAGHETVALTLTWAWYLLSQYPDVEAKLLEELHSVLGERVPTIEDLPSLSYTEMVVKETMRLYPISWLLARETIRDVEIGGYRIPAGQQVWATPWIVHYDPRYYESPQIFMPERWENERGKDLPKCAYLPFGAGPRVCLGNAFATMELILVIATIAQKFQLELAAGQHVEVDLQPAICPKYGMKMILRERRTGGLYP